jgi:pyridoxal phosphate enzyme (YggS family)
MAAGEVAENIARVRHRIAQAAARAGRPAESVTLIAVTKAIDPARIAEACSAGVRDFGENYVQEALAKVGKPPLTFEEMRWHFIGHLQRNKAKEVVGRFVTVQSVDSVALAEELGRRAQQAGQVMEILLEIKLDPATTRFGLAPDRTLETAARIGTASGVRLCGLMGMAPFAEEPESARPCFRQLANLFRQLPRESQQMLSMGMTGDFEVAVEEGATHVRIGTAIFGKRRKAEGGGRKEESVGRHTDADRAGF